jgi:hypothetical protein
LLQPSLQKPSLQPSLQLSPQPSLQPSLAIARFVLQNRLSFLPLCS